MKGNDAEIYFDDRLSNIKPSISSNYQSQKKNHPLSFVDEKPEMENNKIFPRESNIPAVTRTTEKAALKNIKLDAKTKTAIQIIRYDVRHKFEFNDEAEEVIYLFFRRTFKSFQTGFNEL